MDGELHRVGVTFRVHGSRKNGSRIVLVGDVPELGRWDLQSGIPMPQPHADDTTSVQVFIETNRFLYTYAIVSHDGMPIWFMKRKVSLESRNPVILDDCLLLDDENVAQLNSNVFLMRSISIIPSSRQSSVSSSPSSSNQKRNSSRVKERAELLKRLAEAEEQMAFVGQQLCDEHASKDRGVEKLQRKIEDLKSQFKSVVRCEARSRPARRHISRVTMPISPTNCRGSLPRQDSRASSYLQQVERLNAIGQGLSSLKGDLADVRSAWVRFRDEAIQYKVDIPSAIEQARNPISRLLLDQAALIQANQAKCLKERSARKLLRRRVYDLEGKVRVFCRVRPVASDQQDALVVDVPDDETVCISDKSFKFDAVFDPTAGQSVVFEELSSLVDAVLDGWSSCVFAYGQTSSGKTFTMEGPDDDRGVTPRALERLFSACDQRKNEYRDTIRASALEIYNETLRDLLCDEAKPLDIQAPDTQSDPTKRVSNLTLHSVNCVEDVERLMDCAAGRRSVGSTNCNERSSRSHCLVTVYIESEHIENGARTYGRLCLIDLAGSERIKSSNAIGERLAESRFINKSLSALGNVIRALGDDRVTHVPYRDSKLTYLLQDCMDGSSRILALVHVNPLDSCAEETLCSLRFAEGLKQVRIGQVKRQCISGDYIRYKIMAEVKEQENVSLRLELDHLRSRLARLSAGPSTPTNEGRKRSTGRTPIIGFSGGSDMDENQENKGGSQQRSRGRRHQSITPSRDATALPPFSPLIPECSLMQI